MLIILTLMVFASIVFLITTIALQRTSDIEVRLRQIGYTTEGKAISQEEAELAKPFSERIIKPLKENIANRIAKILPLGIKNNIKKKLIMAGRPPQVNEFLGRVAMFTLGIPLVFGGLMFLGKVGTSVVLLFVLMGAGLGFIMPNMQLSSQVKKRQKAIQKSLPDVLDLLTVSVEAGLGFDQAMAKVVEKAKGPIAYEFDRTMQEIRMNKPRQQALRDLAERVGVEDLNTFVSALIQADQLGVSIAKVLRVQSEQMRVKRRLKAQEQAQQAPVKMAFPLVFFIFPSMFIVLFGPVVLMILETMGVKIK